jgi:hypothetical protein
MPGLRRNMTISQPALSKMILHQKLRQFGKICRMCGRHYVRDLLGREMRRFGKMCRMRGRHSVTSYWINRYNALTKQLNRGGFRR